MKKSNHNRGIDPADPVVYICLLAGECEAPEQCFHAEPHNAYSCLYNPTAIEDCNCECVVTDEEIGYIDDDAG